MTEPKKQTRRSRTRRNGTSSREAMHALRSKPPQYDPCPPGQAGGQYKPLSDSDLNAIFDTAIRILGELGMGEAPDLLEIFKAYFSFNRFVQYDRETFPGKNIVH